MREAYPARKQEIPKNAFVRRNNFSRNLTPKVLLLRRTLRGQHSKMTIGFALQTQRDKNTVLICYRIRFRQQTWTPLPVQSLTKSTICSLLMAGLSFFRMFPNQNWSRKKGLCILEKDLHIKQTARKLS